MFLVPFLCALAAMGWEAVIVFSKNKYLKLTVVAIVSVLYIKTGFWMVKNHPNHYVYFNELVGGIDGAFGNYETDTYSNVIKQGVDWLIDEIKKRAGSCRRPAA